jgi:hypothetical protein
MKTAQHPGGPFAHQRLNPNPHSTPPPPRARPGDPHATTQSMAPRPRAAPVPRNPRERRAPAPSPAGAPPPPPMARHHRTGSPVASLLPACRSSPSPTRIPATPNGARGRSRTAAAGAIHAGYNYNINCVPQCKCSICTSEECVGFVACGDFSLIYALCSDVWRGRGTRDEELGVDLWRQ